MSTLRLVYPTKVQSWFQSSLLKSHSGAAKYWAKVLARRDEIWGATTYKIEMTKKVLYAKSLKDRIRAKIDQRRRARLNALGTASSRLVTHDPFTTPTRQVSLGLSSDSDDSTKAVIDLLTSPADPSSSPVDDAPAQTRAKMAPHPK